MLAPFINLLGQGLVIEPDPALHCRIEHLPKPSCVEKPNHKGTCAFPDVAGVTGAQNLGDNLLCNISGVMSVLTCCAVRFLILYSTSAYRLSAPKVIFSGEMRPIKTVPITESQRGHLEG